MTTWRIIPRPWIRLLGDEASLSAEVLGATIIINGEPLDLSGLEDGDVLPRGSVASTMTEDGPVPLPPAEAPDDTDEAEDPGEGEAP